MTDTPAPARPWSSARLVPWLRGLIVMAAALPWVLFALGIDHAAVHLSFAGFCHQMPERSLTWGATTMVVCSRCAGLYAGIALGAVLPWPERLERWGRVALLTTGLLMLLEVVTQDLGWHPVFHPTRVGTGLGFGYALSGWLVGLMTRSEPRR